MSMRRENRAVTFLLPAGMLAQMCQLASKKLGKTTMPLVQMCHPMRVIGAVLPRRLAALPRPSRRRSAPW